MRIAVLCSNYFNIKKETANGTAIFAYSFISKLAQRAESEGLTITAFASGKSELPVPIVHIADDPSSADPALIASGKNVLYEQTLLAKAFAMQDSFDLYHVNIGDGDIAMPFAPFVKRPILVTLHHILDTDYMRKYFSLHAHQPNVFFISASNAQRRLLPDLPYLATIYHGVDPDQFTFNERGGESLMWAGRAIPEKGVDLALEAAQATGHDIRLFGIPRVEYEKWFEEHVVKKIDSVPTSRATVQLGFGRHQLIEHFQASKAFVHPTLAEESFGLVLIEAMSCGTPVIAFARGSIPEVVADGETGFIVNVSDDDVRGDWIVKKTGLEGLQEAIERLYAMPSAEYERMRHACRERVMRKFTIDRMVQEYIQAYRTLIAGNAMPPKD